LRPVWGGATLCPAGTAVAARWHARALLKKRSNHWFGGGGQKLSPWVLWEFDTWPLPTASRTSAVADARALRRSLERLSSMPPQYVELVGQGGRAVCLGIGGPVACVEWRGPDGSRRALAEPAFAGPEIEFRCPGGDLVFEPEYLIPVDLAVEIVVACCVCGHWPAWAAGGW
jgi:hypothetical protein